MRRFLPCSCLAALVLVAGCAQKHWGEAIPPNAQVLNLEQIRLQARSLAGKTAVWDGRLGPMGADDGTWETASWSLSKNVADFQKVEGWMNVRCRFLAIVDTTPRGGWAAGMMPADRRITLIITGIDRL